jgi:hypothetical protein
MVAEPHKELRFTRSGQAVVFFVAGAVFCGVAVTLIATGVYRPENPELPHPAWAVPCLVLAVCTFILASRLTKHAYLILTPIGLEIFPFFRPAKGMQMVFWQEIYRQTTRMVETISQIRQDFSNYRMQNYSVLSMTFFSGAAVVRK